MDQKIGIGETCRETGAPISNNRNNNINYNMASGTVDCLNNYEDNTMKINSNYSTIKENRYNFPIDNSESIALFLYDYTTEMAKPWAEAGFLCYCVDIQHAAGETREGNIVKVGTDIYEWLPPNGNIYFVAAFPPCTDIAVSGAAHFKNKGLGVLSKAIDQFDRAIKIAEWSKAPYMIENPVSTISTYWRKPDYTFHPYEYGGYLPEDDINPVSEIIPPRDAYPKRTCLWNGNGFVMPEKKPVECPPGYSPQHKKLGGKSQKTKNIRSATPRGFARAVFEANALDLEQAA